MSLPLAYFLTWTGHGTRLHGDERGTVDRFHNRPSTPFLAPDSRREDLIAATLVSDPFIMTDEMRRVVDRAIRDHAALRNWILRALSVRTTHVHVIVDCRPVLASGADLPSPEKVMQEFKSWATRRLRRAGLVPPAGHLWTDHGSTPWINDESHLAAAVNYVLNLQ